MTEINGLDERISELKILYQEAERLNLKDKAIELLVDINYLEELRELRRKQEHIEQKWIPVTEKLPEEEGFYLVTRRITDDVATFIFRHTPTSNDYWKRCATAWMPLPQPYKEESEE